MALEIDGFAVFHSIGSHRAAFAGITADLVKAAQTLVVKLIKDKKTGLATLCDIRTALGAETFNLIADGMTDYANQVCRGQSRQAPSRTEDIQRGLAAASCPRACGRLCRTNGKAEVRAEEGEIQEGTCGAEIARAHILRWLALLGSADTPLAVFWRPSIRHWTASEVVSVAKRRLCSTVFVGSPHYKLRSSRHSLRSPGCARAKLGGFVVNVFDLDRALVGNYERFARSFTQIGRPTSVRRSSKSTRRIAFGPNRSSASIQTSSVAHRSRIWPPTVRCAFPTRRASFVSTGSQSDFTATRRKPSPRPPGGKASRSRPEQARVNRSVSSCPSSTQQFGRAPPEKRLERAQLLFIR